MQTLSPKRESLTNGLRMESLESFELEKSSIELQWGHVRERKLSPWENKMHNSKLFKTHRKQNLPTEKSENTELFLKKIFPKHSRTSYKPAGSTFSEFVSPPMKKNQSSDQAKREDQFASSFVYLPIRPIKIETQPCDSSTHKHLTLTSFRQKLLKDPKAITVAPRQIQISFSQTTYRSTTAEAKIKNSTSISFRRRLKRKESVKLQAAKPHKKGTLNDMYNLLGISIQNKQSFQQYENIKNELRQNGQQKDKKQDISWCVSLSQKRNRTKKSAIICKTVYI